MSAFGTAVRLLTDPTVRRIVAPLAQQVAEWIRGGERPGWLDGALREVPDLRAPVALAERQRAGR